LQKLRPLIEPPVHWQDWSVIKALHSSAAEEGKLIIRTVDAGEYDL
jgi:hypothetical protein